MTNFITKPEQSLSPQPKDAQFFGPETQDHYACWYKKELGEWFALLCDDEFDTWMVALSMSDKRINELVSLKETAMTNKHPHAEMIKAKADNMDLVVFRKRHEGYWIEVADQSEIRIKRSGEYFLCLPKHNDSGQCLHWLNGGNVQALNGNWITLSDSYSYPWEEDHDFMDGDIKLRIKPRKEKRWVCVTDNLEIEDGTLYESCADANENSPGYKQIVEIEVEV